MKSQKKIGVLLSYLNLALSMVTNIFLTPMIITALGDESYSIYKVMQSFAGPLIMFNLGVSTIVTRAVVKYQTLEQHNLKEKQNTLALAMLTSAVMAAVVAAAGAVMCGLIPTVYGKNYSPEQLNTGKVIFVVFVASTIFHILTDAFTGCVIGHERFAFNSAMPLLKSLLRFALIIAAIQLNFGAVALAVIDCAVAVLVFALSAGYALFGLKERPRLTYINKRELLEMLSFSVAILLQAVVNQVNNNVDTMILGAMIPQKQIITMYSSALIIYSTYNSLVSVMSSFFLPKATRLVTKNATGEQLTDFVIAPGRYQAVIAVAVVLGFALFGKDFIAVWIGPQYSQAYYVTLMLIVPVTIPLVENTAISILDATLKRIFRSVVLVIMAAINVAVSIALVYFMGFWGAAIGTVLSILVGHVWLMNWYYKKTFKMNIGRLFQEIFRGILPMGLAAALVCLPAALWFKAGVPGLILKILLFVTVYGALLWRWGLQGGEKANFSSLLRRFKRQR